MKKILQLDKVLVYSFFILLILGLLFFLSASLGVLASNTVKFAGIVKSQLILGFLLGIISLLVFMRVKSIFWQKASPFIFLGGLLLTILVYIPGIGFTHGGARRWIDIGPISLQPAEFLKAGALIFLAFLYSKFLKKDNAQNSTNLMKLLAPALIVIFTTAAVLLPQPDTKSVVLIFLLAVSFLFVCGLPYKFILPSIGIVILIFAFLISTKPYIANRFKTFLDPEHDPRGSSYQLRQSLIGLGNGGVIGQGFGQSIQKFNFLPEPQGDSIFAVVGEEVGFVGSFVIIGLYLVFILRGIKLALTLNNPFGRMYLIGFFSLFAFQTFLNIGSTVGVIPLTGVPLPLMSQGGTSLLINLALFGIVLRLLYENKQYEK